MMHTKRLLFVVFLVGLLFSTTDAGWTSGKKKKMPCAANIEACSDQGCGTDFDPNLNKLKNIRSDDPRAAGPATPKTLTSIKKLDDPENFEKGASREELTTLGEGQKVSVVAYLLV